MLSRVEATPLALDDGPSVIPFTVLAVAFLWFEGMTRTRSRRKKLQVAC